MGYSDPDKQRAYQRLWVARRRLAWIQENGPCVVCGSHKDLEVDHINPSLKTMQPASIWGCSLENRLKELANCQVLCRKCHKNKTLSFAAGLVHGTQSGYGHHKCRCDKCTNAHRIHNAKYRVP